MIKTPDYKVSSSQRYLCCADLTLLEALLIIIIIYKEVTCCNLT